NADFLQFSENLQVKGYTENEKRKVLNERLVSIEPVELGNYFYLNQKNYNFGNQSREAGIDEKSLSSGAAYVDLDNDGDLDVVVNNINRQAFVFLNNTNQPGKPASTHFIRINLAGVPSNAAGFGARVFVYAKDGVQLQEQMPVRGYLSSVDQTLIFGLGNQAAADSIVVIWPNDRKQTLRNVQAGGTLTLHQTDAGSAFDLLPRENNQLLAEVTSEKNVMYKHLDVPFNDFAQQRLLPQKYSQQGPYVTAADINNDGLEDFYAGGGFNSAGGLFMQQPSGTFISLTAITKDVMQEETDCLFFDADKDGDNDLLVTYGDMRFEDSSRYYRPTLFLNDGKGHFTADEGAIPSLVRTIAGCVRATDFDNDGYIDLFIGGRVSHQYPKAPGSFLLKNTGGVFTDVTKAICPELEYGGMISSATWADIDNDRMEELVVAGEWMPIRIFKWQQGLLKEITGTTGLDSLAGMWRSLVTADVDKDGDLDIIAGNLGENCKYRVSANQPMKLFAKDIDGNGSIDPVPFYYIRNRDESRQLFPAINKDQLSDQVPAMKKMFLQHNTFSTATVDDIFRDKSGMMELTCAETASCYFENTGAGQFIKHPLPREAQFAPVNAIICEDMDGDGINDLLLAGNEYHTEVMTGRYDASYGLFLKGSKKGFRSMSPVKSGFLLDGDVRSLTVVRDRNKDKLVIAGVNNDSLRIFSVQTSAR
ncbi:MAG TPA: FG-GAP-like repeat-containing protein, partial [Chitinophagaceae bacterium]|nr:FG-GAP-like repeat-containing protein [Chitinophagaceae bacterium]